MKNENQKTSIAVLQDEHALLRDSGRDNVLVHRRYIVADRIQQRKVDVQGVVAVRLFHADTVPHCLHAPVNKFDGRICSPRGLRRSYMWTAGARLLSNKVDRVPFEQNRTRSGHSSRVCPSAQPCIQVGLYSSYCLILRTKMLLNYNDGIIYYGTIFITIL